MDGPLWKLHRLLDARAKALIVIVLGMGVVGALLEGLGIGLIIPFIELISSPDAVQDKPILRWAYDSLGLTSPRDLLFWLGGLLLGGYLIKNMYLAFMHYIQYRILYREESALARRLWTSYLHSPYAFHLQRTSAQALKLFSVDIPLIFSQVLVPACTIVIEGMVMGVIVLLFLFTEPLGSVLTGGVLGAIGLGLHRVMRRTLTELGTKQENYRRQLFKVVNDGMCGIKEFKVLNREILLEKAFALNSLQYAQAFSVYQTAIQLPRLFIEAMVMMGVVLSALVVLRGGRNFQELLPVLAVFMVGAVRLAPSLSRIMNAVGTIRYYRPAIDVIYDEISLLTRYRIADSVSGDVTGAERTLRFKKNIEVKDVWFQYPGAADACLKGLSLVIPKGKSVALIGRSGAGKTTLVDLVIGLLKPSRGEVLVDGVSIATALASWQRRLGYVPQEIYLCAGSIRENVAFGLPSEAIDEERVWQALDIAQLAGFVRQLPHGLDTTVGERGVCISGGQRQRLGIARALYHDPEVVVMDEATAALDAGTERELSHSLEVLRREKTLIVIAHRAHTVAMCDVVYQIHEGQLVDRLAEGREEVLHSAPQ